MLTRIFLQSEFLPDIAVVEVPHNATPEGIRAACKSAIPPHPERDQLFFFVEDDDDDLALDKHDRTCEGVRIHAHRLRAINVTVRYAGREVVRSFRPSTTLEKVKRWATKELDISGSDGAELMLQIESTDRRPSPDVHIGSLVQAPEHELKLDLVPSPRVNGSRAWR